MIKGDKIGIVGCSNGQPPENRKKIKRLERILTGMGLVPMFGTCIYEKNSVFSGTARERAEDVMGFYRDEEIKGIFDISGGDLANEVLPYLDFQVIGASPKLFWGYSDLTVVLNAIYARCGKPSVLYQIRNLAGEEGKEQIRRFQSTVLDGQEELFRFSYSFYQREEMKGVVVGGNIRCLLKLAGTEYWPETEDRILLLEAFGGTVPQMVTYLNQLKQLGVFEKAAGILLGTFTKMEEEKCRPDIVSLVKEYAGAEIPIAGTGEIGHGADSRGIVIGRELHLKG